MDSFANELRIVLVGKTGTGKSSTGNTILNFKAFEAENQVLAVTGESSFGTRILDKKKIVVVDTPGILDTHRKREDIEKEIVRSIGLVVPGPHAVLYVMRIGDRLTDDEHKCIRIFTDMFGENIFKFAIVVFTKGNDLEGKTLTQYFQNAPEPFQNLLRKCGNRMLALDNKGTDYEKKEAVNKLLKMIDTFNSGQTYYTDEMLQRAQVAFLKRVKEIGHVDEVRKEIESGGHSFKTIMLAVGFGGMLGGLLASFAIVGPAVVVANVGVYVGVATAKASGSAAVAAAQAGGSVAAKDNTMEQSTEIRMALVGKTGTGKSTVGNVILKKDYFRRCVSSVSVTQECKRGETIRNGTHLAVVDTPGLFHTDIKQNLVKKKIVKCMKLLSPGPHVFLYVFHISRHSTEEEQTLIELEDIFGDNFFKYCIVLFVTDNTAIDTNIDEFLETLPYFYRDLADKCNRRIVTCCAVEEYNDDTLLQIRRFQKEIAKQEPPYYSIEMVPKSQSRFDRVLFKPVKSILCWLRERKKLNVIIFVLIIVGGCYHFVCNSPTDVSAKAT